jgi:hypothetical protein
MTNGTFKFEVQHTKSKTELSLREQRFVWCLMQFSFTPWLQPVGTVGLTNSGTVLTVSISAAIL